MNVSNVVVNAPSTSLMTPKKGMASAINHSSRPTGRRAAYRFHRGPLCTPSAFSAMK